jgi:hypothetical protein
VENTPITRQQTEKSDKQEDKLKGSSRWEKGKRFKCKEPWVPGHNKACKFRKQVHLISIQDDDSSEEETTLTAQAEDTTATEEGPELQIYMHALSGTSSHAKTFPLFIHIGHHKLVALVDSGSTSSFIDPTVIDKVKIEVENHDPVQVTVANGNSLWTHAITHNCFNSIHGHDFTSDFRVLELQGYDIILGCNLIYDYSPVELNLKTREFTIEKQSQ